jgi:hypothetical protein
MLSTNVPRTKSRGDVLGQRLRSRAKALALRDAYKAGTYVSGSHHREATCLGCGNVFPIWRTGGMSFCSRVCSGRDIYTAQQAIDRVKTSRRKQNRVSRQVAKAARHVVLDVPTTCMECGGQFIRRQREQKFCSRRCGEITTGKGQRPNRFLPRSCKECAKTFTPEYGTWLRSFCSTRCGRKHARRVQEATRRARIRSLPYENVDPIAVLQRDGWTCGICGVDTPRALRGTYARNAPEMDHIIPLSAGGPHTYDNTQCACRSCNGAKGGAIPPGKQNLERGKPSTAPGGRL